MVKKIRKAVFPVAGMGTRFLPATKANPKEMLPVVDKPLIQYAAEEAEEAGVSSLVFVTGRNKRSIPDHFDKAYELESELKEAGKTALLEKVQNVLPEDVSCIYLRQSEALGLGHAVLCAEPVVADEPFAVILADDLIRGDEGVGALEQMAQIYERYQCSVILVEEVPHEETGKYGIVEVEEDDGETATITSIVEKPKPEDAPSNLGVVGRYILTPRIFSLIKETGRGAGGEIQLTDAIAELLKYEKVRAYRVKGKRYDCGSKLGYLEATVELGLAHQELGDSFKDYLKEMAEKL
ncbi:MAG: UTP--glucose-1-phosphate uridylyltransferase GalU [Candidatus Thiodiazotropha lotti]|uniref:UTP--glucose-1-phosphate uridylyltransferase n=1 Tax=Candidatus Thiodiazotropha lotti TaxID=2792787 RepID=A0A9E4N1A4_9GAMM|nr:UTP--glucose-1-phosphate uridylyltransferase GalU [Candidatus Thiodiazotropha lotti]ODB92778.1 UTP--glucose-1-phosphate uridylyltransferase [Candidatus Thiodiazotropha endoloripes]MCG7923675.1 UTP--glucose-1-phosphate uridylyltransferase GalU [Candidatus Thiodiazotropha lotti]MCG7929537.1 UTP--glucose-1-phosphate uridylyltransferase GalU [Candidatus Thiodiazotropha lotti]MCG7939590.1 UTP--glucose-1-phosphate uridylyltransferase GalU [Candidatus Thiodiazotropha lotti]